MPQLTILAGADHRPTHYRQNCQLSDTIDILAPFTLRVQDSKR